MPGPILTVISNSSMRCEIHIKVETADKGLMIQRLNESRQAQAHTRRDQLDDPDQIRKAANGHEEGSNPSIPPVRMLEPDETWLTLKSGNQYAKVEKKDGPSPRWSSNGSWDEGEGMLYV
jgi:hypothetical protein